MRGTLRREGQKQLLVGLADDLVARELEGGEHRLVALDHLALGVEAEVHGGGVFIEVGISILELLELAVDLSQLLVDLSQLLRPELELALGSDLVGDVGEMAAQDG